MPHVFISYARKDGSDEAEHLYNTLTARGIAAWRDTKNLNPYEDFGGKIEAGIDIATHVAVIVTPDVRRADSFVRREIAYALEEHKPIIPLVFPGGRRPITIINHTYIDFSDWERGFAALLERLKRTDVEEITPQTRREHELAYLELIGQRYDHWRDLYTDLAATARIEQPKVRVKGGAVARYLDMQHDMFDTISHGPEDDKGKTVTVENFDELREGILKYHRVALIGDPGAGKTTTLERLAYELATAAAESETAPLPLFARLGAYSGGDFETFLEAQFGALNLRDYLSGKVTLLLDGLNEMPSEHAPVVDGWLRRHTDAAVIVSCRRLDYVGLKLPLQRIDVAPLDVRRIRLFIGNYLEDAERERLFWALGGAQTVEAWAWYQRKVKDAAFDGFWFGEDKPGFSFEPERWHLDTVRAALREEGKLPGMLGVVSNPFLLFVTVSLYTRQGEPPANRGQLFDQFVTLLMEKRGYPAANTRPPWIDEHTQRRWLAALAYRMQAEQTGTSVDESYVRQIIAETLPGQDAEQLLYLAASASLIERGTQVRFVHQLLQEYFAAYEMGEDQRRGVPADKYWPDRPDKHWSAPSGWEETAVLLAGMQGDSTAVVRWLRPVQPSLAYRCATESGASCDPAVLEWLYEPPPGVRICPIARAEGGRRLSERGDARPGVGLRPDGLPDITWCEVPAGEFIYQDDQRLTLPSFWIARYPVTYRQFQAFVDAEDGFKNDAWWQGLAKRETEQGDQAFKFWNHPRERVSWYDSVAFCRWLSAKLKYTIILPTEEQWEKAARGTDGRTYPWGSKYIPGYANIEETSIYGPVGPYYLRQTTAVGLYPQGVSPCGALDMSGNVWEWCLNEYANPARTGTDGVARRVVRGGSWRYLEVNARAAYRDSRLPAYRSFDLGFRVCASAPIHQGTDH